MTDMVWKPDVTVAAVAERDGKFLLVEERASGRLVLNQPAGHLEDGESFVDAVVRETLRGIRLALPAGCDRRHLPLATGTPPAAASCASRSAAPWRPARRPAPPDRAIIRLRWLTRAQLADPGLRLRSPLVLRCVDDYLAGIRYPCSLIHRSAALSQIRATHERLARSPAAGNCGPRTDEAIIRA